MITPKEISTRTARSYLPFLRSWLRDEPFVPIVFPAGAPPTDYHTLRSSVEKLLGGAKGPRSYGYRVELETRQTRAHGTQSLPTRIVIDTPDDLLHLAGKVDEFSRFESDITLIRARLPRLNSWLIENPQHVIAHHGAWPDLLRVCAYFLAHPRPGLYARELPIEVHTKFIETHTGILRRLLDALLPPEVIAQNETQFELRYGLQTKEPLVRLRFLDPAVQARCGLLLSEIAAPVTQIATLTPGTARCLIVENEMTFLTLPPLADTVALWGKGFAVEALAGLSWLSDCKIWYWGDLDAHGFQILSQLRALFPQAMSLLMDQATFETFRAFAGAAPPSGAPPLPHLTASERALFEWLAHEQLRLEQEHITQAFIIDRIQNALGEAQG
ncbi:MAG TPA: Wadjet anti-phage system protein JetD domain-containing protein [Roseiflexaceae bacterium]|nr:Wadjet anti-phage system protein JetD domain-containing protein [Roseiflexaceae bacterium]